MHIMKYENVSCCFESKYHLNSVLQKYSYLELHRLVNYAVIVYVTKDKPNHLFNNLAIDRKNDRRISHLHH